ncbi:MAG TPA: endonuclease Q family protein [Candidatus Acidoferrum sp.]|nr:endonuclease Q family protein [Candidatus Acidoferrum sp.]
MRIVSDLHVHSRFAAACSSSITLNGLEQAAVEKGINLVGTGDFTHPEWLKEIKGTLEEVVDTRTFKIKGSKSDVRFMLSSEVCTISNDKDGVKKIHHCILMPSLESVDSLNASLSKYGSLPSDGRPILSMKASELVEKVMAADSNAFIFPAHAWTPYFGVFGALSGFDSMKEAYEDQEKHIYALESGLSSDPQMNWRISALDKYAVLSTSDMHSLPKMGREMSVFNLDNLSYRSLISAIKDKDVKRFEKTVEFFPEEGKYHFDGHRKCMVSIDPDKQKNITRCPVCGGKIVVGVLHRINDLSDRDAGYSPKGRVPFIKAVPLLEVIANVMKKSTTSVPVQKMYIEMTARLGTEYSILLDVGVDKISEAFGVDMGTAISNMRNGTITIEPGYAGVFGKVDLLNRERKKGPTWKQKTL